MNTTKLAHPHRRLLGVLFVMLLIVSACTMFASTSSVVGQVSQPRKLREVRHTGASVLPVTRLKDGFEYVLVGREVGGPHAGTYDSFGGAADPGENHAQLTAARELSEETVGLLGTPTQLRKYIASTGPNTRTVVVNQRASFVVYLTAFKARRLVALARRFKAARRMAQQSKYREKDSLAWVRLDAFRRAVANAKRDSTGKLVTPIRIAAKFGPRGQGPVHNINLRPVLVGTLQPFFQHSRWLRRGVNPKVIFSQPPHFRGGVRQYSKTIIHAVV